MSNDVSFHRLEYYNKYEKPDGIPRRFRLSFDTSKHGYYEVRYFIDNGDYRIEEFLDEPNMMMFTKDEQDYIEFVCAIVVKFIKDGSMPDFDK